MAGQELRWALYRSAAYLRGRGVTFGSPLVPYAATADKIYSIPIGLIRANGIIALDESLTAFADKALDHVLLTGMVGGLQEPAKLVTESATKLKVGGHLVVLTDVDDRRPGITTITNEDVEDWVSSAGRWIRKAKYTQEKRNLQIFKKVEGRRGFTDWKKPNRRRALVVRYGALGDAIVMTPLLRALHEDGYHITVNMNPYCLAVLENNPYIHNRLIQERDIIPNTLLGEYWRMWEGEYDRYINLCESLEGDLLQVEGWPSFFTTKEWRHEKGNKNYYDYALVRGGYPSITGKNGELYFTNAEERRAKKFFDELSNKFVVVWALNGSSHHKCYPMLEPLLRVWFNLHSDSVAITTGDYMAKLMEFDHPQLIPKAGKWSIRESLIATKYANVVAGPETMMTNASGCFETPKICLLSHSTRENLTKYWKNDHSLEPDVNLAPCWPCHQLHYTKESCPAGALKDQITGEDLVVLPKCSMSISPERVIDELEKIYAVWKEKQPKVTVA